MKMKIRADVAFVVCIFVVVIGLGKICSLRDQVSMLERSRLAMLREKYESPQTVPGLKQTAELRSAYDDIVAAYTNEDLLAMYKGMSRLPKIHDQLQWQAAHGIKEPFVRELNASFLRCRSLRDFETVDEFDRYVRTGLFASRFYGESEIRRKSFDLPIGVEYLALDVLQKYCNKYHKEGRREFEKSARRFREYWVARIEAFDGLTRQCARHTWEYNTIFIRAVRPERALTEAQGRALARQAANGLNRCGYRPKWLREFADPE